MIKATVAQAPAKVAVPAVPEVKVAAAQVTIAAAQVMEVPAAAAAIAAAQVVEVPAAAAAMEAVEVAAINREDGSSISRGPSSSNNSSSHGKQQSWFSYAQVPCIIQSFLQV